MPVKIGNDKNGCFAKWGNKGKKYYYKCGDKKSEGEAKNKAYKQGIAMGENVNENLKEDQMSERDIIEQYSTPFADVNESTIDEKTKVIKNVCIIGRKESANGYIYHDNAIGKIASLSEGLKCFLNHPAKSEMKERSGVRDIRDWAGVYKNARLQEGKVFADLHCREQYFPLIKDIALLQPNGVGNSINARVVMSVSEDGQESVTDINQLRSGDLVASAATTTNLFESAMNTDFSETKTEEQKIRQAMLKRVVEDKLVKEGILQDKIKNDELSREIDRVSWAANDLIYELIRNKDLAIKDKKGKIAAIFDDLDKEVQKIMKSIKEQQEEEEMPVTLEAVKAEKEVYDALVNEIKAKLESENKTEQIQKDLEEAKVKLTETEKALEEAKKEMGDKTKKIEELDKELKESKEKLDTYEVQEALAQKKEVVDKILEEAKLPKEAVTDIFMESLMAVEEKKDGENTITVEEQVKKLVEDRRVVVGNKKKVVKGSGEEFKTENLKDKDIDEAFVDSFVKKVK